MLAIECIDVFDTEHLHYKMATYLKAKIVTPMHDRIS